MKYWLALLCLPGASFSAALPLYFEKNAGQSAPEVRFLTHGSPGIFFTRKDAVVAFPSGEAVRMRWEGSAASEPEGVEPLPGKSNYLNREPAITGVRQFGRIRYRSVYPGIDLVYYGHGKDLEYDFTVAAGARPESIRLALGGTTGLRVDAEGNLVARLRESNFIQHAPEAWQDGHRVKARFVLDGEHEVAFEIGPYDRARALTIDPLIDYATYFGAQNGHFAPADATYGIAADAAGNAYITGDAPSGQLPVTTGMGASAGNMGFVAKLSPDGANLLYATYLNLPAGQAIAVDAQGSAYVAGSSAHTNYVVKLTPDGSSLAYTYLFPPSSGSGTSLVSHVVLDSAQNVYVSGSTADTAFPTTPGSYQSTYPGQTGTPYGFLIKLDASGRVAYSTYTRVPFPAHSEPSQFLAVDGTQDALVLTVQLPKQAALLKLDSSGSVALSNTTFPNAAIPIALASMGTDPAGNVFVTGFVSSSPLSRSFGLVAELDASGAVVKQRIIPYPGQVFVDGSGNALVVGVAGTGCAPGCMAYVTRVDSSFSSDTTYFLGSVIDAEGGTPLTIGAAALDAAGDVYLTVSSLMNRLSQIPATPGAYQTSGGTFAVVKMDEAALASNAPPVMPGARAIAPGEIVTLYGFNLGPVQLVTAGPDSQGNFPTTLAGTRLLIGGQAAALLYSSTGQIGGVAPMALAGDANGLTTIQVEYQGVDSAVVSAPVVTTSPQLFGVVVNQNGSINSPANPAAPGSVVSLYGTGFGVTLPPGPDGAIATSLAWLATPVAVAVGGQITTVPYAGAAPGLVNGVTQINVVIPSGISGDALEIVINSGTMPIGRDAQVAVR